MRTYLKNSLTDKIRFSLFSGCSVRDLMQQKFYINAAISSELSALRVRGAFDADFLAALGSELLETVEAVYIDACDLVRR